ncbi:MAG: type II secretion system protein [Alphaproteobacteria bacterium]
MSYKNKNASKGFTTIEIALVLLVSGLIFTVILSVYNSYQNTASNDKTISNMIETENALSAFIGLNGRYPCPADPTLPSNHPMYGVSVFPCDQCPAVPELAPGVNSNIVCTNIETRDVTGDGNNEWIVIGSAPFRTLEQASVFGEYSEVSGFDGFDMQFTYAVTGLMTSSTYTYLNPVNTDFGAITIRDENGVHVATPDSSAHYTLISHGENRRGAYTREGALFSECDASALSTPIPPGYNPPGTVAGFTAEFSNCSRVDGVFISALISKADDDNFFDDIVLFKNRISYNLWLRSASSPMGITYLYNTNPGNVGVGTNAPTVSLDVAGPLIVAGESRTTGGYCDPSRPIPGDNPECLDPDLLGGAGNSCPPGQIAIGIQRNRLECVNIFTAGTDLSFSCGLDGSGNQTYARGIILNRSDDPLVPSTITPICETL